jgi:hypothetical protein
MQRSLKQFLDLVPLEGLKGCSVDFTRDQIPRFSRPKYTTQSFLTVEELEEFLALTFAEEEVSILTLKFQYCEDVFLELDVLMGNLYLRNSATLMSLEKLSSANQIGKGKLIEKILVEFSR